MIQVVFLSANEYRQYLIDNKLPDTAYKKTATYELVYAKFVMVQPNISAVVFLVNGKEVKCFPPSSSTCGEINRYKETLQLNVERKEKLEAL